MDNLAPIKTEGHASSFSNPEIGEWRPHMPQLWEYQRQRYGAWYYAPFRKYLCREAYAAWDLALFTNAYEKHHG